MLNLNGSLLMEDVNGNHVLYLNKLMFHNMDLQMELIMIYHKEIKVKQDIHQDQLNNKIK
jgi:hypothetical protein